MFPGRSRRHIRSKFVKEEKLNPARLQEALVGGGRGKWDIEVFKQETGLNETDFRDPRVVEEELRVRKEQRVQEIEEQRRETAELKRQRRLAGDYSDEDEEAIGNTSSEKASKPANSTDRAAERDDSVEIIEIIEDWTWSSDRVTLWIVGPESVVSRTLIVWLLEIKYSEC